MQQGPSQRTLQEVWLEVNIEDVAAETLDGVIERQNMDALSVFDVQTRMDVDHIAELDAQVVARHLVHLDLSLLDVVGAQADEHSIMSLLAPACYQDHISL